MSEIAIWLVVWIICGLLAFGVAFGRTGDEIRSLRWLAAGCLLGPFGLLGAALFAKRPAVSPRNGA